MKQIRSLLGERESRRRSIGREGEEGGKREGRGKEVVSRGERKRAIRLRNKKLTESFHFFPFHQTLHRSTNLKADQTVKFICGQEFPAHRGAEDSIPTKNTSNCLC